MTKPATIELDRDKAYDWLMKGAQPTETVRAILRFKGVLYRKHLSRGVSKGAFDQDTADKMYQEWIADKEAKVDERKAESQREKEAELKRLFGTPTKKAVVTAAPATEALEEFNATDAEESPAKKKRHQQKKKRHRQKKKRHRQKKKRTGKRRSEHRQKKKRHQQQKKQLQQQKKKLRQKKKQLQQQKKRHQQKKKQLQ